MAARRIDNQIDLTALDVVHDMWTALVHLVHRLNLYARIPQNPSRSTRGDNLEPDFNQIRGNFRNEILVVLVDADECHSLPRQNRSRADLRFHIGLAERVVDAHHLAGGLHLGTEDRIDSLETRERKHRRFHEELVHLQLGRQSELAKLPPDHHLRGNLRQRNSRRFTDERYGTRRTRIHFEHVDFSGPDRKLNIHKADDIQSATQLNGVHADGFPEVFAQLIRRQDTRTVAGVNASLLDV